MTAPLHAPDVEMSMSSWIEFEPHELCPFTRAPIDPTGGMHERTTTTRYEVWTQGDRRALVMVRDGRYYMLGIESDHADLALTEPTWVTPEARRRTPDVAWASAAADRIDARIQEARERAEIGL